MRVLLSSGGREGASHTRALGPVSGEGRGGGGQGDLSASAISLNSFSWKQSICQSDILGVACPEPHQAGVSMYVVHQYKG